MSFIKFLALYTTQNCYYMSKDPEFDKPDIKDILLLHSTYAVRIVISQFIFQWLYTPQTFLVLHTSRMARLLWAIHLVIFFNMVSHKGQNPSCWYFVRPLYNLSTDTYQLDESFGTQDSSCARLTKVFFKWPVQYLTSTSALGTRRSATKGHLYLKEASGSLKKWHRGINVF